MEKLNENTVLALFEEKGYTMLEPYKNSQTKILCEKDGYRYRISYSNLRIGKTPSRWGINNYENLEYNVNTLLKEKHSHSKFVSSKIVKHNHQRKIIVTFECECGNLFNVNVGDMIGNIYILCGDCVKKRRGINKRKTLKAIRCIEDAGFIVLDKTQKYSVNDYIEVVDSDGYKGFVTANHINRGCGMSRFDVRVNRKYYIYNVNHWAEQQSIGAKCIELCDVGSKRQGLKFICDCGNIFTTTIASFQNGKIYCDECAKSISKYERIFKSFLEEQKIQYIYQYSLNQCRDVLPLPFDFFLPEYKLLVEIDGEGHYRPCHFNQIGYDKARETFIITKKHDKIKDDYCANNNLTLLRIPYTMFDKDNTYQEFFLKFIEE